jgi:hypothetical protein
LKPLNKHVDQKYFPVPALFFFLFAMRKRYNHHITSVEQYRFRNRFSHTTNITKTTQTSPNVNNQVLLNDSMDFHENYSNDDQSSKFDSEDEYEKDENKDNEERYEEDETEDYDDYYEEDEIEDYDDDDDDDYEEDEIENDDDDDDDGDDEEDEIEDYDDDDDDDGKEDEEKDDDNDDEFLEDPIIDAPIDRNQMSRTNGSFSPYFENTTSALLFCWMQKHNICKFK